MIRPLIIAIAMALPLLAQEPTSSEPQDTPPPPPQGGAVAPHGDPHHAAFMEKFDTNKDGRIDEKEKEAIRTAFDARKAEFQKKILEKYDANKDGQLDEQEKEAFKAAMEARKAEFMKKIMEKYDANKDGQLDEQEKAAARADSRHMRPRGPHRGRMGHGPGMPGRGCRPNPPCEGEAPQTGCCCCPPPPPPCCCGAAHRQRPCGPRHHHHAAPVPAAPAE